MNHGNGMDELAMRANGIDEKALTCPLGEAVLKHLEEWGYREHGDDFGDLTLGEGVLTRLEEWGSGARASHRTTSRSPTPEPNCPPRSDRWLTTGRIHCGTETSMADASWRHAWTARWFGNVFLAMLPLALLFRR